MSGPMYDDGIDRGIYRSSETRLLRDSGATIATLDQSPFQRFFGQRYALGFFVLVFVALGMVTFLTHASAPGGAIAGLAGKCLDNQDGRAVSGNPIHLFTCNGTVAQQWQMLGDGTVQTQNFCLDVTSASGLQRPSAQLSACNHTASQQWVVKSGGAIVNLQTNLCLEVKDGVTTNDSVVWISTCDGSAAQQWTLESGVLK